MISTEARRRDLCGESTSAKSSKCNLAAWFSLVFVAVVLQGCASNVKEIKPMGAGSDVALTQFPPGVPTYAGKVHVHGNLGAPISFQVSGEGTCTKMYIDFGDGTPHLEVTNVDLASKPTFTHTYAGWNGKKTVTAYGVGTSYFGSDTCGGTAKNTVVVGPFPFKLGYGQPVSSACMPVPNQPPLRKNTTVDIRRLNNTVIDFGCVGGCNNGPEGISGSVANSGYPFPGLRERSLVFRVGTQVVQGGILEIFTTTQAGPLEVCVNDYKLDDNSGAWGLGIMIDESAAE